MATWDAWYPDILVDVPGAPLPLVDHALRRAAREFFKRTRAWMVWLDPQASSGVGGTEYDFDLPAQSELVRVEQVTADGEEVPVTAYRQLTKDWTRDQGAEQGLVSQDMQTFTLLGTFAAAQAIQVQASLRPSQTASGLPDGLQGRYLEAITQGAKATLLLTSKAAFRDPEGAVIAQALFEEAISKHAVDAFRSHTNTMPRARVQWC